MTNGPNPVPPDRLLRRGLAPKQAQLLHVTFISLSLVLFVACLGFDSFCLDGEHFGPGFGALADIE